MNTAQIDNLGSAFAHAGMVAAAEILRGKGIRPSDEDCGRITDALKCELKAAIDPLLDDVKALGESRIGWAETAFKVAAVEAAQRAVAACGF